MIDSSILESPIWTSIVSIIGAILGALISGIVAIWMFKKGAKQQTEQECKKENGRLKELENHLYYTILFMIQGIEKQEAFILDNIEKVKDFDCKSLVLEIKPELTTDDVNKIGDTNSKEEDFYTLKNSFRHLDSIKEHLIESNKLLIENLEKYREIWYQGLKELTSLNNSFINLHAKTGLREEKDDFSHFYNKIIVIKQTELIKSKKSENIKTMLKS